MQEIIGAKQESRAQSILKLLRYRSPLAVGDISLHFEVSPQLVDTLLSQLKSQGRVKTDDGVFWQLGSKPNVKDGCEIKPIAPLHVVLCGPSHAGKSTFARRFCNGFEVISSDRIRKRLGRKFHLCEDEREVWNMFESLKYRAVREGHDIVLDACHMSERARMHALEGVNSRYEKICIVFDLPVETIQARCLKSKRLSLKEAERMWRAFQDSKPTRAELEGLGFDEIHFVRE